MKTKIQSLSFLATLAVVLGMVSWGGALHAQTAPAAPADQPQAQPQQPTPDTPPAQQAPGTQPAPRPGVPPTAQTPDPAQAPNPTAGAPTASDSQVFSGTVVKSGDKYVLKDDAGKTYEIDHQDDVKKFEGKRVRVQGTLDVTGTKIQVK